MANKGLFNEIAPITARDMHKPTFGTGEALGLFSGAADGISGRSVIAKAENTESFRMGQP